MLNVFLPLILVFFYARSAEALGAAAITAAASAILTGTSLTGTTLNALANVNYKVVCGIEVENWTKFTLTEPSVQIVGGALETPANTILPGRKEAMVARKTSDTATEFPPRRAVVMWSAPYDFNFHDNWLGLGLTNPSQVNHPFGATWFNQMYYGSPGNGLGFSRKNFVRELSALLYEDNRFQIVGTMSSSHKAMVKITVRPQSENDLADSIKALM